MGLSDDLHRHKKKLLGGYSIRDYVPPRKGPYGLELHAPLANFEGPRTDIVRRLREGVKPTTHTDAASKKHDIAYYNISQQLKRGVINKMQAYQKIKQADNSLMKSALVNKISVNPVEHLHSNLALAGMAGKRALQSLDVMPELSFVGTEGQAEPELTGTGKIKRKKKKDPVKGLRKRFKNLKISKR